jgi:predicted NBD/HSP70 family sugar kinase
VVSVNEVRAGSKELIREINQALVLNTVRRQRSVSRTDIAGLTGLSPPTISGITNELIERGLLFEASIGESAGGRKPILLSLNAAAGYVVGIKLTETQAVGVLADLDANVEARHSTKLSAKSEDYVVAAVTRLAKRLAERAHGRPVLGIGVGLAGVIDRHAGIVRHATYLDWRNADFATHLRRRTGLPVVIDNDINALVANERWFRHGRDVNNLLVVSVGRGVGLGMVLDGRIYRGAIGGAGEFGHVTIDPEGPACDCGKRGCLEAFVADPALERAASEVAGRPLTLDEALHIARADPTSPLVEVFHNAARTLGRAVSDLVNILNPDRIVLTGEGIRAADLILDTFTTTLNICAFDGLTDDLEVLVEPWDDEAWARGAASVLLGELFQPEMRRVEDGRPSLTVIAS